MHRNKFQERYQKIGETDDRFDVDFWQTQGGGDFRGGGGDDPRLFVIARRPC